MTRAAQSKVARDAAYVEINEKIVRDNLRDFIENKFRQRDIRTIRNNISTYALEA